MRDATTRPAATAHCEAEAQRLRALLIDCGAYAGKSKRLTSPALLAYFVGWCEGALRQAGIAPDGEEGLEVLGSMLWVVFDESLLAQPVSNSAIASAYFDFRRSVIRKDPAVHEAYRTGGEDLGRGAAAGRPPGLQSLLKPRRKPAASMRHARDPEQSKPRDIGSAQVRPDHAAARAVNRAGH